MTLKLPGLCSLALNVLMLIIELAQETAADLGKILVREKTTKSCQGCLDSTKGLIQLAGLATILKRICVTGLSKKANLKKLLANFFIGRKNLRHPSRYEK